MNGISGLGGGFHMAAGALRVHSIGMVVSAHNIANVSTAEFVPQTAIITTGTNGNGVVLQSVASGTSPLVGLAGAPQSAMHGGSEAENGIFSRNSGTELAKEFPRMMTTQSAFESNAKTISAIEDMYDVLPDIKA